MLSKIPDGMRIAMAQNLWNDSTPQVKAIRWLAEEDGLEVDPAESEVLVQRYTVSVIFYATGVKKRKNKAWIHKAHFLSNMSVFHWNERDEDDLDKGCIYRGTTCTDVNSEVNTLSLGKFLKNVEH